MSWNFRAIKKSDGFSVHGVYYNDIGDVVSVDSTPYVAHDDSLEELITRLRLIVKELETHGEFEIPDNLRSDLL